MNLVDEQHIALVEIRQQAGKISSLLYDWAAGNLHVAAHLAGENAGERGLAEARRAAEQNMVERLAALLGCLDRDAEPLLDLELTGEIGEHTRPQRSLEACVRLRQDIGDPPVGHAVERLRSTGPKPQGNLGIGRKTD